MNDTARGDASFVAVHAGAHDVTVLRGGTGPPLLYLHGLCDVHAVWRAEPWTAFLAQLATRRSVVAPALPGYHGTTGLEAIDDVEDVVWFLADVVGALGLGELDLVGHSLGGWFAAELALRRPELVRRLALVAPLGVHVHGGDAALFFGAVAPRGIGGMGEARRVLFGDPEGSEALSALPDAMTDEQQLQWYGGLAGAARLGWKAPHFQSRKLTSRLPRVTPPTLVVCGEVDALVTEEAVRTWVEGIPHSRLVEVPDAGHCLALESPHVAAEVGGFLDEN